MIIFKEYYNISTTTIQTHETYGEISLFVYPRTISVTLHSSYKYHIARS